MSHVDLYTLMMNSAAQADAAQKRDDATGYAMFTLIEQIIAKLEGMGSDIADIGNESSAFSTVQMDMQHVDKDISKIQQWRANPDHKPDKMTPSEALADPEYQADVKAFATDMQKLQADVNKFKQNYNHDKKSYGQDGMDEASDITDAIMNTTIPGSSQSIGQMIADGKMGNLGLSLLKGADATDMTAKTGPFCEWFYGKGSAQGLTQTEGDFQMFTTNFNQTLNEDSTYLTQIQQSTQADISSTKSLLDVIIQNFRSS